MANAVILPGERLAGLSADLFHKVQKGNITLDELDHFLKRKNPFETVLLYDVFRLMVDYGQSLEQMIDAGRYDYANNDITTKRFPIKGEGKVEFEGRYFHFNRTTSSKNAIAAMKEAGWEPANIEHLLVLGEKYPDEQRKFPIIGLGSVAEVDGDRSVPCLDRSDSGRNLYLSWFGHDWDGSCRFLAVRNKASAA